jgi:hypothetical protein
VDLELREEGYNLLFLLTGVFEYLLHAHESSFKFVFFVKEVECG